MASVVTYFIQNTITGEVKIGKTNGRAESRLKALQTASPHKLRVVAEFTGDREREFHEMFKRNRLIGEWFDTRRGLLAVLCSCATEEKQRPKRRQMRKKGSPDVVGIIKKNSGRITVRSLMQKRRSAFPTAAIARGELNKLVADGFLVTTYRRGQAGRRTGRPVLEYRVVEAAK